MLWNLPEKFASTRTTPFLFHPTSCRKCLHTSCNLPSGSTVCLILFSLTYHIMVIYLNTPSLSRGSGEATWCQPCESGAGSITQISGVCCQLEGGGRLDVHPTPSLAPHPSPPSPLSLPSSLPRKSLYTTACHIIASWHHAWAAETLSLTGQAWEGPCCLLWKLSIFPQYFTFILLFTPC